MPKNKWSFRRFVSNKQLPQGDPELLQSAISSMPLDQETLKNKKMASSQPQHDKETTDPAHVPFIKTVAAALSRDIPPPLPPKPGHAERSISDSETTPSFEFDRLHLHALLETDEFANLRRVPSGRVEATVLSEAVAADVARQQQTCTVESDALERQPGSLSPPTRPWRPEPSPRQKPAGKQPDVPSGNETQVAAHSLTASPRRTESKKLWIEEERSRSFTEPLESSPVIISSTGVASSKTMQPKGRADTTKEASTSNGAKPQMNYKSEFGPAPNGNSDNSSFSCPATPTFTSIASSVVSTNFSSENSRGGQPTSQRQLDRDLMQTGPVSIHGGFSPHIASFSHAKASSYPYSFTATTLDMTDPATLLQRLFNNPLYSDMALVVDETTFHVHRGVLAEQCAYFRELFEMARKQDPTAEIKSLDCSYRPITLDRQNRGSVTPVEGNESTGQDADKSTEKSRSNGTGTRCGSKEATRGVVEGSGLSTSIQQGSDSIPHNHTLKADTLTSKPQLKVTAGTPTSEHSSINSTDLSSSSSSFSSSSFSSSANINPVKEVSSSAIFVASECSTGYTSHHFAVFLQILYGVFAHGTSQVCEMDLLPVFRIAYVFGVPGLVAVLAMQIFESVQLSRETWPAMLRFLQRYRLQDLKMRALNYASTHRELWTLAVEMLDLEDFKVFLRGIRQEDVATVASDQQKRNTLNTDEGDLRGIKDELLMMFLLVHYLGTLEDSGASEQQHYQGPERGVERGQSDVQEGSRDKGDALESKESGAGAPEDRDLAQEIQEHGPRHLARRISRSFTKTSPVSKIRQQLQLQPLQQQKQRRSGPSTSASASATTSSMPTSSSTASSCLRSEVGNQSALVKMESDTSLLKDPSRSCSESRGEPAAATLAMQAETAEKAERAKTWMMRFKRDCAWDGKVSLLD